MSTDDATPFNNKKRWSNEEDEQLMKRLVYDERLLTYGEIAEKLHRTVDAVQARFVKKYIVPKYNEQFLRKNTRLIAAKYNIKRSELLRYLKYAGLKCYADDSSRSDDSSDDSDYTPEVAEIDDNSGSSEDDDDEDDQDTDSSSNSGSENSEIVDDIHDKSFKLRLDIELNILHIAMIAGGSFLVYYLYPTIMRSI